MHRGLWPVALLVAVGVVLFATAAGQANGNAAQSVYIVQFAGKPLATYTGGVPGFAATHPAKGHLINTHSANALAYSKYLANRQHTVIASAGVATGKVVYSYTTALNGMALRLTAQQAAKLTGTSGVTMVEKSRIVSVRTKPQPPPEALPPTPEFLGLTGMKGVWNKQFGGDANAGNGVIIGDIDTGFWPENPSFAALPEPRSDDAQIAAQFHGTCDTSGPDPVTCNNKVLGARFYNSAGLASANPGEHANPRDFDGHGSHTASTAAGDPVNGVINGQSVGPLEGMAPGARLSIYKVLYENAAGTTASGSTADIVAAVNQAIDDGVNVINFSVGDNVDTYGATELAFLNASASGVFVSAAAGNAGPGASTIDNAMPWETTDAAGTFDRAYTATVTLGNGSSYTGVGLGTAVPSSPLIDSVDAGMSGADPTQVELCFSGTLDPAKVAGKIVLCKRGSNARIDKSKAVQLAGGVGMVLYNVSDAQDEDADFHFVPSVHVNNTQGLAIKSYIHSTASPTASLSASVTTRVEAPQVAGFSSVGPSLFNGGDLTKPDIMAPGVNVVAGVSPENHSGNLWDSESGTSMATPHIAGVAALLLSKHPNWGVMDVKSALMTTANPLDNAGNPIQRGGVNATPFDMGSGEVNPGPAFDPGLTYESGLFEWVQYSCGVGVHLFNGNTDLCDITGSIAPNQLNYPSIAAGALPGVQTITRTVTNVDSLPGNYKVHITNPDGYSVKVSPDHFVIQPGQSLTYSVTITRTTAPLNAYAFGQLVWTDQRGHSVRSPISVQGVALAAPTTASGTGASGSQDLAVTSGYNGTLNTSVQGLAQSSVTSIPLVQDDAHPFNTGAPATSDATGEVDVTIPAGTPLARFATFGEDYPAGTDVDIYVYKNVSGALHLVGVSAGGTATESVTLANPSGDYVLFVNVFAGVGTINTMSNVFVVPSTDSGNLTATPASQPVTLGNPATVTLNWSGLASGRWLGLVNYSDGTNNIGSTLVSIDNHYRQLHGSARLRLGGAGPAVLYDVPLCVSNAPLRSTKHVKIVGVVAALLGCAFLAGASAATPMLNTIPVRTSSADEYGPSSQGSWFSWTQASHAHPNHPDVFAQYKSGAKLKVNARGTKGAGSSIDGNTLVYYEWKGSYTGDIRKFDLVTHRRSDFPAKVSTRWDEYDPSISGPWVLFTRFILPTLTTKELLYNTRTHELRTLGTQKGRHSYVYAGQVNGDYVTWGRVRPGGLDVYLYRISTKTNTTIPNAGLDQYDPAVTSDGTMYFGRSGHSCGQAVSLVRYTAGGVVTVLHDFPAGTDFSDTSLDERVDGSLEVFFSQENCQSKRWDIYKAIDSYTVSIAMDGTGTGRVTSDPAYGIYCGPTCNATVHGGRMITLTASDGPNSVFSGWTDASCGSNPVCAIDVEADTSVTATFNLAP